MNTYVGSRTKEWANCLNDLPDQPAGDTPTTALENFSGTYTLEYQGGSCGSPPTYVTVNQTARTVAVSLNGKLALGGTLNGDNTFDASHSEPVDFNLPGRQANYTGTFRVRGRFDKFGDQVLIRDGIYEVTIDTTCTNSFTGRRQ